MSQPTRKFFTALVAFAAMGIRQGKGTIDSFIDGLKPEFRRGVGRRWNQTYGRTPQPFDATRPSARSAVLGGPVRGKPFGPDRCRRLANETDAEHLARIFPAETPRGFGLFKDFDAPTPVL